jgi:hypothetical protein
LMGNKAKVEVKSGTKQFIRFNGYKGRKWRWCFKSVGTSASTNFKAINAQMEIDEET